MNTVYAFIHHNLVAHTYYMYILVSAVSCTGNGMRQYYSIITEVYDLQYNKGRGEQRGD